MTWLDFKTELLNFLDVDARRRGIEAFRDSYIRAGIADLGHYIDEYNVEGTVFINTDMTPFDSEVAEAIAEFVKAKITRNVNRDLATSQEHMRAYMNLRRRLFVRSGEERTPELRPFIGKDFVVSMNLRLSKLPCPIIANVWFTVKRHPGELDENAIIRLQRGEGIEVLDEDTSRIRVTFSADDTAKLNLLREYYWDVQVEDVNHRPVFPVNGMMRPRQPVTETFNKTIMLINGDPLMTIAGVPISFIT